MTPGFVVAGLIGLFIAFENPRAGIVACVLVGFLADPIRKFLPGQPVYLQAVVVVFAGATFLGFLRQGARPRFPAFLSRRARLVTPVKLFAGLVVAEAGIAFLRTQSLVVAGIGLLAYFAPFPAILIAYYFARGKNDIFRFLRLYVAMVAVFVFGVFLSILGFEGRLLEAIGEELVVYSKETGEPVRLLCGFLRSSEIAAWHAGTAVCLLVVLWVAAKHRPAFHFVAGPLAVFLIVAIMLTGRRKSIALIVIFLACYGFFLHRFRRGANRLAVVVFVFTLSAVFFGATRLFPGTESSPYRVYFERGETTTPTTAWERLRSMASLDSLLGVIRQNGFFGAGAGTGSQGAQHYGGGADVVGYGAEGGFGKVLAELGVPGLALLAWIVFVLARSLFRLTKTLSRGNPALSRLSIGILSLLGAELAEFATAHQAFGDPFVLLVLGWLVGFVLAILRLEISAKPVREPAAPRGGFESPFWPTAPAPVSARPIEGIPGWQRSTEP